MNDANANIKLDKNLERAMNLASSMLDGYEESFILTDTMTDDKNFIAHNGGDTVLIPFVYEGGNPLRYSESRGEYIDSNLVPVLFQDTSKKFFNRLKSMKQGGLRWI